MMTFLIMLLGFIYLLNRIEQLERKLKSKNIFEMPKPSPDSHMAPSPIPAPQPTPMEAVKPAAMAIRHSEPLPAAAPEVPQPTILSAKVDHNFEAQFGSKIFTIVGAIAVLFGIGYFLRYAIDHNYITELGRVIIGLVAGAVLLGLGEFLKTKYAAYAQSLSGLGLGVMYLSVFASFNFYHLVSLPVAFAGMAVITVIGIGLALRQNSEILAGFAQLGGFVTPFLLATGQNNIHGLFAYVLLLDAGLIALSFYKPWKLLYIGSLLGTILIYLTWFGTFYTQAQFGPAFGYLTVFFLLFLGLSQIQRFRRQGRVEPDDLIMSVFTSGFYYIFGYIMIHQAYPALAGLYTLILGIIYLAFGFFTTADHERDSDYRLISWGVSFILFTIAVPVQFDKFWISLAWAAEALVFIFIGFQMSQIKIRYWGHVIFVISTIKLLCGDFIQMHVTQAWANPRVVTGLIVAVLLCAAAVLYWTKKHQADLAVNGGGAFQPKNEYDEAVSILLFQAYAIVLFVATWEIFSFHPHFWYPVIWSLIALGAGVLGLLLENYIMRLLVYLTFIGAAFNLIFFDYLPKSLAYTPVFNTRALSFALTLLFAFVFAEMLKSRQSQLKPEEKELVIPAFYFSSNILVLWLITREINSYYELKTFTSSAFKSNYYTNSRNVALSVAWTLYAAIILVAGIAQKSSVARIFATTLLGVVVFKVFLYDAVSLNNLGRFISYITLGIILLLAGYLYNRYKDRIAHFIKSE